MNNRRVRRLLTNMNNFNGLKESLFSAPRKTVNTSDDGLLLDLESVPGSARSRIWQNWVSDIFPGMVIDEIEPNHPVGIIKRIRIGPGHLWAILTTGQKLHCELPSSTDKPMLVDRVAIMVQMSGNDEVVQHKRRVRLSKGDVCLITKSRPFQIEVIGVSTVLLFSFPTNLAESAYPHLLRRNELLRFPGESAEIRLFRNTLIEGFLAAESLSNAAGTVLCRSLISLFSIVPEPETGDQPCTHWRIKQALQDIHSNIFDNDLSPERIARQQNISRRRLDSLFQSELGTTIAAQILEHKLTQAASELCNAASDARTIKEVAYNSGFKDPAHFTRAFKRRFGQSPSTWKQSAAGMDN